MPWQNAITKTARYSKEGRSVKLVQNKGKKIAGVATAHTLFAILSVLCVIPIVMLVSISLSDNGRILREGYSFLPRGFTLEAYKYLMKDASKILGAYRITLFETVVGTLSSMICTVLLSYVISRRNFKYRNIISFIVMFTMLFRAGMFPSYYWITNGLGLKNNLLVLILPGCVTAWNVLLMKSFFLDVPEEIIEAASIDGCNNYGILVRVVLPLSKAALATVGLFTILRYFNDWQSSMLYMNEDRISVQYFLYKTLNNIAAAQANTSALQSYEVFPQEPVRMAIAVVSIVPIIVVFPFLQKYFVKGITLGAVKG